MTTERVKQRWPLAQAQAVAVDVATLLRPACERIEIAGSIRRGKPDVGDIELLCVSKVHSSHDLFGGEGTNYYALDALCDSLIANGLLAKRPSVKGAYTYGPMNKLLIHRPSGIPVDVFTTTAENWGMAMVVRTGPADFNVRMMSRFKELHMAGHAYGGVTDAYGKDVVCPDEETVFRLMRMPYVAPEARK